MSPTGVGKEREEDGDDERADGGEKRRGNGIQGRRNSNFGAKLLAREKSGRSGLGRRAGSWAVRR